MVDTFEQALQSLREAVKDFAGVGQTSIHGEPALALRIQFEVPEEFEIPTQWRGFLVDTQYIGVLKAYGDKTE